MNIKNTITHEHRISATFDEYDVRCLLTKHLAEKENFAIDPRGTKISVTFESRDMGSQGFKNFIKVEMVNDLHAAQNILRQGLPGIETACGEESSDR